MSGEYIRHIDPNSWVTVATGLSLTAGTFVQASSSDFDTLLSATAKLYPEFEILINVTSGTPTENNTIEVHERMGDGTNLEPAPSGDFAPHFVGSVTCDNQTGYYFEDGLAILSENAQIYLKSNEASTTLTVTVKIRAKTGTEAA